MDVPNLSYTPEATPSIDLLSNQVIDFGPTDSDILFVRDYPEYIDCVSTIPFNGTNGSNLRRVLASCGRDLLQTRTTYACRCAIQDPDVLLSKKGVRAPAYGPLREALLEKVLASKARVVVPLGDIALSMLSGSLCTSDTRKYRGSIYSFSEIGLPSDQPRFLIPTFSPSVYSLGGSTEHIHTAIQDMKKIFRIAEGDDPEYWTNRIILAPSFDTAIGFLKETLAQSSTITFDIETLNCALSCFGLTRDHDLSTICIPLVQNGPFYNEHQEVQILSLLSEILYSTRIHKIAQNGMFDFGFLYRTLGIQTRNFTFDTMLAQHLCYTDLPKGLNYLCSIYTDLPYYKDDGKNWRYDEHRDWQKYWKYNALDCISTWLCAQRLKEEVRLFKGEHIIQHLMQLHKPLLEMECRGLLLHDQGRKDELLTMREEQALLQAELDQLAGAPLNVKSSKQLREFFYTTRGFKPYTTKGRVTCNEKAISRLIVKGSKEAALVAKIMTIRTMCGTFFEVQTDLDSTIRCSYKIAGTFGGRLASEQTLFGTGTNLQNQPPQFRKHIIPQPGYFFIEADEAQAEAVVVAFVSGDQGMMDAQKGGIDGHTFNASQIFNQPYEELLARVKAGDKEAKNFRALGKKVAHASNYDMGYRTFSLQTGIPENHARELLEAYHSRFPGLRKWHASIRRELQTTRVLYNLFGRGKRFLEYLNDSVYKSAYAYIPQSTVGQGLNEGLVKLANDPRFDIMHLNAQIHDSVLGSIPLSITPEQLYTLLLQMREALTLHFTYDNRPFQINIDFKLGFKSWAERTEIKTPTLEFCQTFLQEAQAYVRSA